jgi:guanylate kinase
VTVPIRTEEQRASALLQAMEVRRQRAALRLALKAGQASGAAIIRSAGLSGEWQGVRVRWLLESLPRIGPARADSIMRMLGVAETRRLGGLTDRQRDELIGAIEA